MQRMKELAVIALCLAACVPAQAADRFAQSRSAGSPSPARALPPQMLRPPQVLPAQPVMPAAQLPSPRQELPAQQAAKSAWTTTQPGPKAAASMAILFTDDHDSTRLPAFATRTTPLPTRFMRLGVEWSF